RAVEDPTRIADRGHVLGDHAFDDVQPGGVAARHDPAARLRSVTVDTRAEQCHGAAVRVDSTTAEGDVVANAAILDRHLAGNHQPAAAHPVAVGDGQPRQGDGTADDVEDGVDAVSVDLGIGLTGAGDGQIRRDVEVAG